MTERRSKRYHKNVILNDRYDIGHLNIIVTRTDGKTGQPYNVHIHSGTLFKCDLPACGREFARPRKGKAQLGHLHFCSPECHGAAMRLGGPGEKKRRATSVVLYGEESYSSTDAWRAEIRATKEDRYGDPDYCGIEKRFATNVTKYGSRAGALAMPETIKKCRSPETRQKRWNTMVSRGTHTYFVSKPERLLFARLCETFGTERVKRQQRINDRPIDIYVEHVDTYIQVDGVHWHGLDISRDELNDLARTSDHYSQILDGFLRDRQQDELFISMGMRLIRVTDRFLAIDGSYEHLLKEIEKMTDSFGVVMLNELVK